MADDFSLDRSLLRSRRQPLRGLWSFPSYEGGSQEWVVERPTGWLAHLDQPDGEARDFTDPGLDHSTIFKRGQHIRTVNNAFHDDSRREGGLRKLQQLKVDNKLSSSRSSSPPEWSDADSSGQVLFKDEQPEMPTRQLSTSEEAEFSKILRSGASAEALRAFIRSCGIQNFKDNFDEVVRYRDKGAEIPKEIQYRLPDAPKQKDGAFGAGARGFANPISFLDEIGAVADTLGATKGRQNILNSDRSLKDIFYDNIDQNRSILEADQRDHPWATGAGQLTSSLLLPIGNKARTPTQIAKWAAAEGFLSGLGSGEGTAIQRLPGAAANAVLSGTAGFGAGRAFQILAPEASYLARKSAARLRTLDGATPVLTPGEMKYKAELEKYIAAGKDYEAAHYLASPYDGRGHHYFPEDREIELLGYQISLPDWYVQSRFNILKPPGISNYEMAKLHFGVDPTYFGGPIAGRKGKGSGLSGRTEGFEKYGKLGRLWHGAPDSLKVALGVPAAASAGLYKYGFADNDHDGEISSLFSSLPPRRSLFYMFP